MRCIEQEKTAHKEEEEEKEEGEVKEEKEKEFRASTLGFRHPG